MLARIRPRLGDYSIDARRLSLLSLCALLIGLAGALVARLLLLLIGAITHLAYTGTFSTVLTQPDPRHWGPLSIGIPIVGGVVVGLIARFGSDKIRGHGIPEAIQSILERDSVVQARVAFWKPIASAITIGTGAPFGAEGPIIMTGGGLGSLFAQFLHLSSLERRTLLVAGAAAGMSATFGAPIASVLIAVELLLFEWRPRSFIPVAIAAFVADFARTFLIGPQPPFVVTAPVTLEPSSFGWALILGLCGGAVSLLMTKLVYLTEELYERLPIHWMWWPAIGGVIVGIGGWFVPQALGVGYPTISGMLNGQLAIASVAAIILVKIVIWIASLSSGTSGGVLAPLLMIGAALGTIVGNVIPGHQGAAWAVVGMAALMGGTMRAPFMGTLFALETTHAWGLAPGVFIGCAAATAFTVLFVPRSILTEKLARRGMHVFREYAVDPLEFVAVGDVMTPGAPSLDRAAEQLHAGDRVREAANQMAISTTRTFAVVDDTGQIVGSFGLDELLSAWRVSMHGETRRARVRLLRRIWHRRQLRRSR